MTRSLFVRFATTTLLLFVSLCCEAAPTSARQLQRSVPPTPYNKTSFNKLSAMSTTLGSPLQIDCGDNAYCTGDYPICCPAASMPFCIPAGQKCCSMPTHTSCLQSELCCDGGYESVCCGTGAVCTHSSVSMGEHSALEVERATFGYEQATRAPMCKQNNCTIHLTPDRCLSDVSCGWCCDDHRCIDGLEMCPSTSTVSKALTAPITGLDATCPDLCSYAVTCGECMANSQCSWCCASQSCSSGWNLANSDKVCSFYELIPANLSIGVCAACLGDGTGLYEIIYIDGPLGKYATVLAIVICLVCITAITALTRYLFIRHRRLLMAQHQQNVVVGEWGIETVESALRKLWESPRGIRQYGLKCRLVSATAATQSLSEEVRHETVPQPCSEVCGICKAQLATHSIKETGNSSPGVTAPPRPGTSGETASSNFVLFLPCGDALCFACCTQALPKTREDLQAQAAGGAEITRSPAQVMQQLAKLSKKSTGFPCPCCRALVQDSVIGAKVVSR